MSNDRPSQHVVGLPAPVSELPWSDDFVMQAIELLVIARRDGELVSLHPDCAGSLMVGWPARARPEEVAAAAITGLGLRPIVLHSTSWRHSDGEVVLTYLTVVSPTFRLPDYWEIAPVARAAIARGDATAPPPVIGVEQVLEHALRHLAWLVQEDELVSAALPGWTQILNSYVPEPFRALGSPVG
jgi:hypothetical protein